MSTPGIDLPEVGLGLLGFSGSQDKAPELPQLCEQALPFEQIIINLTPENSKPWGSSHLLQTYSPCYPKS